MEISRRRFLKNGATLAATWWFADLFPTLTFADDIPTSGALAPAKGEFLVYLQTVGGLDVTLGLDPWVMPSGADSADIFIEYRPDEILSAGGLRLGPAAAPLVPHAGECLILNGIMTRRDIGHSSLYMASGRGDGKAAPFPLELAVATGSGPFGVIVNSAIYTAGKPVSLSTTKDLEAEAGDGTLIALIEERIRLLAASLGTPLELAEKQVVEGKAAAMSLVDWLKKLNAQFGKLTDYHVMTAAFASGATRHALLDITNGANLDTHSAHEKNHLAAQKQVWQRVADIFALFKKIPHRDGSLFDATTFVVYSEMSRTPALNASKGKDHNPFTNSALIAGRGIQRGKTVGASKLISRKQTENGISDHIAWPYDYKKKKLADSSAGASFLFPENLTRTMAELFGNPPAFTAIDGKIPTIPGILTGT